MARHYIVLISLVVAAHVFSQVNGACFLGQLKVDRYCEHEGKRFEIGANWALGFPQCVNCSCSENGMNCCGYGIKAGMIQPPEGKKLKPGQCAVEFIADDSVTSVVDTTTGNVPVTPVVVTTTGDTVVTSVVDTTTGNVPVTPVVVTTTGDTVVTSVVDTTTGNVPVTRVSKPKSGDGSSEESTKPPQPQTTTC